MAEHVPIGLQLYSVRDEASADLAGTLEKVAEMGYAGVEFAGFYDHSARDIRKMLDDTGLECCGSHSQMKLLDDEHLFDHIDDLLALQCPFVVVPGVSTEWRESLAAIEKLAAWFGALEVAAKGSEMQAGYHAHSVDMKPLEDGRSVWQHLADRTSDSFIMQIDTGNARHGGGDPVALISEFPGRSTTVHLKPFSSRQEDALIGEDEVDWQAVFEACESVGGVEWYIVEYEHKTRPPLESVRRCLDALREMGK